MIRRKLKEWVLPALGLFILTCSLICYSLVKNLVSHDLKLDDTYVTNAILNDTLDVHNEIKEEVIKPYQGDNITISKYYYNPNDDAKKQEKSLIKYQNIYMPNTGILYSSDNKFDCIAIMDGKVVNIKEDNILGNIIEIEHEDGYHTVYESVSEITVNVGDPVKQGDIIAKSGPNKLEQEKENCLHFEVYKDGSLINPEDIIDK